MRKLIIIFTLVFVCSEIAFGVSNPFRRTQRQKELKYEYQVQKDDARSKFESDLYNRHPTGYMTVEEYEKASEYKDKTEISPTFPKIEKPSDFKYVPQKIYKITKYNSPPGSAELTLGNKLFYHKQLNAQGIVSPDYTMIAYPAVYYYGETGGVASDIFTIPLDKDSKDSNLAKIMKANVARRDPNPILSTDKEITNQCSFRTLTPVDFSSDGTKLLVKEKLGSSEDGIWETRVIVYDFTNKTSYELPEIRDAISYFWKEYMHLNLAEKRWDIYPLGFDSKEPYRIVVNAYAYTGEVPVYLGTWSIDYQGNQSRMVSFDNSYIPNISSNGFKIVEDGVESYQTVKAQEKSYASQSKYLKKQVKKQDKENIREIKENYKFTMKEINADYKDDKREINKLESLKGSTSSDDLQKAYEKYVEEQTRKDIKKKEKQIIKKQKEIDRINKKIEAVNQKFENELKQQNQNIENKE